MARTLCRAGLSAARGRARRAGPELAALIAASIALLAIRAAVALRIGYGDSEALYASYALHPQLAYLDHPGLIGFVARAIGGGTAPAACRAHAATAVLATLVPWEAALVCRACGAAWRRCFGAALIVAVVPEMAIGLFALTPDLPLCVAWLGALGFAAAALRSNPGERRAAAAFVAAGLCGGVATAAKVTGGLLLLAMAVAYSSNAARAHRRTPAPWVGLVAGGLVVAALVAFESETGWAMLRHRLVDTQATAGISIRNVGALVGGQALYLSPLVAVVATVAARAAWKGRRDAVGSLLWAATAIPAGVLAALCLWSKVAEPHWLAPAWLALVPAGARAAAAPGRRLLVAAGGLSAVLVLAVHAWVLVPMLARVVPDYDARIDIANELYGWPEVVRAVRDEAARASGSASDSDDLAVVGPHWVICAQLEAALGGRLRVGCDTPITDDFDTWWPRKRWRAAQVLIWVTDARFGPPPSLRDYALVRERDVHVERAGREVRAFVIATLERRAAETGKPWRRLRPGAARSSPRLPRPLRRSFVLRQIAVRLDLSILVRHGDPPVELAGDILEHSRDRRDDPVANASEPGFDDLHRERAARVVEQARERGLFGHAARELGDALGESADVRIEGAPVFGFDVGHRFRPGTFSWGART